MQSSASKGAGTISAAEPAQEHLATHPAAAGKSGVSRLSKQVAPGEVKPGWATTEFWQTSIVHVIAAVVALGTVFHTHFNLNGLQAIVPSLALVASAVAQGVYSHSRATVKSSAQAAGARVATRQGLTGDPGAAPIVVQLAGVQPAHIGGPELPSASA